MSSNWRNRPTTIDYISDNIDWIVGIDESGNSSLKPVIKAKNAGKDTVDSERHFTVTATAIKKIDFETARDMVMGLKNKYWKDAMFTYKNEEKRICFHSREIRGRKEAFNPEIINYEAFITDLSQIMADIPLTLYASHIDKVKHVNRYLHPIPTYDLCMTFILERVLKDMGENETCIIVLESRGKREDKELLDFIKGILEKGTRYHSSGFFEKIKGVYFNPKWCASAGNKKSYWELELADLYAYPIHKYFVHGEKDKAFQTLIPKISCYPNFWGEGT